MACGCVCVTDGAPCYDPKSLTIFLKPSSPIPSSHLIVTQRPVCVDKQDCKKINVVVESSCVLMKIHITVTFSVHAFILTKQRYFFKQSRRCFENLMQILNAVLRASHKVDKGMAEEFVLLRTIIPEYFKLKYNTTMTKTFVD